MFGGIEQMDATYISGTENVLDLQSLRKSATHLVLRKAALAEFIERFLRNDLTELELQEVGDLLEGEPVDYEDDSTGRVIAQILVEMSTPEANGPINRSAAERWSEMLRS